MSEAGKNASSGLKKAYKRQSKLFGGGGGGEGEGMPYREHRKERIALPSMLLIWDLVCPTRM